MLLNLVAVLLEITTLAIVFSPVIVGVLMFRRVSR